MSKRTNKIELVQDAERLEEYIILLESIADDAKQTVQDGNFNELIESLNVLDVFMQSDNAPISRPIDLVAGASESRTVITFSQNQSRSNQDFATEEKPAIRCSSCKHHELNFKYIGGCKIGQITATNQDVSQCDEYFPADHITCSTCKLLICETGQCLRSAMYPTSGYKCRSYEPNSMKTK